MPKASPENSRIKMSILKSHSYDNETWWSPAQQNSKPAATIVAGMIRRFKDNYANGKIVGKVNVLMFYEDKNLIHKETIH